MGTAEVIYGVFGRLFTGILAMAAALLLMAKIFSFFYQSFLLSSDVLTATALGMVLSAPSITDAEQVEIKLEFRNLRNAVFGFPLPKTFVFLSSRFPAMVPALGVREFYSSTNIKVYEVESKELCGSGITASSDYISNIVDLSSKLSQQNPLFKVAGGKLQVLVKKDGNYQYITLTNLGSIISGALFPLFKVPSELYQLNLKVSKGPNGYYGEKAEVCISSS